MANSRRFRGGGLISLATTRSHLKFQMLDPTDQKLLALLVWDARLSLKEIAGEVGLSSPSVAERIRRLRERGILQRFTIEVDAKALGFPIQALVRIRPLPGKSQAVQDVLEKLPQVAECDKVTGDDCFVARIFVKSQPVARRPAPIR